MIQLPNQIVHSVTCPHHSHSSLSAPSIPPHPLLLILLPIPCEVNPPASHTVDGAEPNGRAPHDAPRAHLGPEPLPPPQRHQRVQAAPRGRQPARRRGEARQVEVRAQEERRREEQQRQGLPGPRVQGDDERAEQGGRDGGC